MVNLRENQARGSPTQAVLVVGGGIGGMRAALDLADAGQTMTERIRKLGPNPLKDHRLPPPSSERGESEIDEEPGWHGRRLYPGTGGA
ncbi:MAG: FAD-binding protein [Aggregatilineaceae bacterium]